VGRHEKKRDQIGGVLLLMNCKDQEMVESHTYTWEVNSKCKERGNGEEEKKEGEWGGRRSRVWDRNSQDPISPKVCQGGRYTQGVGLIKLGTGK